MSMSSHVLRSLPFIKFSALLAFVFLLCSCAALQLQPPQVALVSISPVQTQSLELSFDVRLKVTNPNAITLPLQGMTYAVALNGAEVFQGATGNLPTISPYGSENVDLRLSANLLSAPKFLLGLLNDSNQVRYELSGKVDLKGAYPSMNFRENGEVNIR